MIQGNLPAATVLFEQTLELQADFLPAVVRLGRSKSEEGRGEEARGWFERALALDPTAAAAFEGLGKVASSAADFEGAVAHFNRALELEPTANGLHYALAQAHRNLGHLDLAQEHLAQAGDVRTRVVDPLINPLADLAANSQFFLVQGAEAMDDGNHEAAVASFRAALDRDDSSFAAWRGLARSLERLGDVRGAMETFENALLSATTGDADADRREQAAVLRALGSLAAADLRETESIAYLERSLALEPEQSQVELQVANGLARQRRFEEALKHYDHLLKTMPGWVGAVLEKRATVLVNLKRYEAARKDFMRALKEAPEDRQLHLRFAEALELMGDRPAAASQRLAAEGLVGGSALEEARILARSGQLEPAVRRLQKSLATHPDHLDARFELASMLGHQGKLEEASAEFANLVSRAPRQVRARRGLILTLLLGDRYGEARIALQDALRTFPRHAGFALTQVELLATVPDPEVRDGELAFAIAQKVTSERQDPVALQALAFAQAAAGHLAEAADLQRQLMAAAEDRGAPASVVSALRERLATFEAGRSWTAGSGREIAFVLGSGS
jgi:tetratricopeptide (TPR) repeat protein